jgi:hypothetical protein
VRTPWARAFVRQLGLSAGRRPHSRHRLYAFQSLLPTSTRRKYAQSEEAQACGTFRGGDRERYPRDRARGEKQLQFAAPAKFRRYRRSEGGGQATLGDTS